MIEFTIAALDKNKTVKSNIQELKINRAAFTGSLSETLAETVTVVINGNDIGSKYVDITMRPVAVEQAMQTHKLNRELALGYSPPLSSTRSR